MFEDKRQQGRDASIQRFKLSASFKDLVNKVPGIADDDDSPVARNVAMGVAGALPFAGLVGQPGIAVPDAGQQIKTLKTLKKHLRPGDIVLTGDPPVSFTKVKVNLATGTPFGYHVAAVGDDGKFYESHPYHGFKGVKINPRERIRVLRPNLTPEETKGFIDRLKAHANAADHLEAEVIKQLKPHFKKDDAKFYGLISRGAMYDAPGSVSTGAKELFLPKSKRKDFSSAFRRVQSDRAAFYGDIKNRAKQIAEFISNYPAGKEIGPDQLRQFLSECQGDFCSSAIAKALPVSKRVSDVKLPRDVLPSDYLRAKNLKPVAHYYPETGKRLHEHVLTHAPTLTRLGVGTALAGGVYGASKLIDYLRNREG